jgi:hypothetical protein
MRKWPRLLAGALPHARGGDLDMSRPVFVSTGILFGGIKRLELPSGKTHRIEFQAADVVRVELEAPASGDEGRHAQTFAADQRSAWIYRRGSIGNGPNPWRNGAVVLVWLRGGGRIVLDCDAHWALEFERLSIERSAQDFAKQLERNPLAWGRNSYQQGGGVTLSARAAGSSGPDAMRPDRLRPFRVRTDMSPSVAAPDARPAEGIVQW